MENHTAVAEFLLLGIPHSAGLEKALLLLLLAFYSLTLLGNLLILLAVLAAPSLHSPMYFFLGNLAVFDLFFPSVSCPKMMLHLTSQDHRISYQGCAAQLFFYHFLGCAECLLYTAMAYDRFVAICLPLRYSAIMGRGRCAAMAAGAWAGSSLHASVLAFLVFRLPYCGPNQVANFFCDIPVVLSLACADASLAQTVSFTNVGVVALVCFLLILSSYARIVVSILRIRSSEGRRRAFSTCSAHLTSIVLFYGPVMLIYLQPAPNPALESVVQVLNNIVAPSLNPLIYSLRNKEVKSALTMVLPCGVGDRGAQTSGCHPP